MGCVQAKPSSPKSALGSLDSMKQTSGYVPARRSTGGPSLPRRERPAAVPRAGSRGPAERKKVPPLPPARAEVRWDRAGEEEVDDGWPQWLTDNIPREVLAGMVRRSADSYDKLAKDFMLYIRYALHIWIASSILTLLRSNRAIQIEECSFERLFIQIVGQGTYSNVYKARDRDTGKIVALKKVRFDTSETESVRFMAREIMILQKLDHPNIIKLEGLATSRMQYSLYLVFDFMCTDLSRVISRPEGKLTEPQVKCYMHQLLSGLHHCHERGILHRDIKGSNLLIDKQGRLKIGDFGLANYFDPKKKRPLTSRVVTLWYRAPELLLGTTDYGVGIDLWSAGCLLAEMFAGRPIMPGRTEVEQLHRIFKLCGSPPEDYWRKMRISTSFRPPKPYKPNIVETFRDFPSSSFGLLKSLLALDPAYRGSASSALQNEFFTTSPFACELSGLPVVYKEEEDEIIQPQRKRRSSKLKHRSLTQKEGQMDVEDIMITRGDSVLAKEEKTGARTLHSQELGSSTTGSTSFGAPPDKYYVKSPPSLSPVDSLNDSNIDRARHSHELSSNITSEPGAQAYSYYVSSPPSISPLSSPLLENAVSLARNGHELNITTTGTTSSDEEPNGYTVSPPTTPSPVKSPDTRDRITKNVKNLRLHMSSSGNMKSSIPISGSRIAEKKQMPKRFAVG